VVAEERCESGRIGLTANELTGGNPSEGSNPSLSAKRSLHSISIYLCIVAWPHGSFLSLSSCCVGRSPTCSP